MTSLFLLLFDGAGASVPSPAPPVSQGDPEDLPGVLYAGRLVEWARDESPAFGPALITPAHAYRMLSMQQHTLLLKAQQRDSQYLMQRWAVALDLRPENALAQVGAGTPGGVPSKPNQWYYEAIRRNVGMLVQPLRSARAPDGLEAIRAATSWTATSMTDAMAVFVPGAFVGQVLRVAFGPGSPQDRAIADNDVTTIHWTDPLDPVPEPESLYGIYEYALTAPGYMGVQTSFPGADQREGFLVRFDGNGQPFIDLTRPLIVPVRSGIPLPPNVGLGDAGEYVLASGCRGEFQILPYSDRVSRRRTPTAYVQGQSLFLNDPRRWGDVVSLDVPYQPTAPHLRRDEDVLLLPDAARAALVYGIAVTMGRRAVALKHMSADELGMLATLAADAETTFLASVGGVGRARRKYVRDAFGEDW